MKGKKTAIFLISFFMLLGIAFIGYVFPKIKENQQKQPQLPIVGTDQNHHVAPFSFVNQDGKIITNDDVKGKICVVEYFYATCKGMCPKMNENMEKVYKAYLEIRMYLSCHIPWTHCGILCRRLKPTACALMPTLTNGCSSRVTRRNFLRCMART